MPRRRKFESEEPSGEPIASQPQEPQEPQPQELEPHVTYMEQVERALPTALKEYAKSRNISVLEALHELTQEYFKAKTYSTLRGDQIILCINLLKEVEESFLTPSIMKRSRLGVKEYIQAYKELLTDVLKTLAETELYAKQLVPQKEKEQETQTQEQPQTQSPQQQQQQQTSILDKIIARNLARVMDRLTDDMLREAEARGIQRELAKTMLDIVLASLRTMAEIE
ncbi:MAG: hypothetical protein QXS19_09710 [Candidatus Methanomethylicia archaeon]